MKPVCKGYCLLVQPDAYIIFLNILLIKFVQ